MKRIPKTLKGFVNRFSEKRLIEILNTGFNTPRPKRKARKPKK